MQDSMLHAADVEVNRHIFVGDVLVESRLLIGWSRQVTQHQITSATTPALYLASGPLSEESPHVWRQGMCCSR